MKLGLYNHGGWGGTPENMVAVCNHLHTRHGADHVGIVYNFHHAHHDTDNFAASLEAMKPYLLCLNLNGMLDPEKFNVKEQQNKIRPIGSGTREVEMVKTVIHSGYNGPIGILDHRNDMDSEVALNLNLVGVQRVLSEIEDGTGRSNF